MTEIKLSCGFEAEVDEEAINDVEMLEGLNDLRDGDVTAFIRIMKLFGMEKEDRNRLYQAIKGEEKRAPIDKLMEQINEIFGQLNSKKK